MTVFDFFNQIVGFLAQTLPVVLLSLVFFPDEVLRDARRRLMLFDTLMMLVLGLGLACGTILIWKLCEAANDLMPLFWQWLHVAGVGAVWRRLFPQCA